jgi:hypothetical protein
MMRRIYLHAFLFLIAFYVGFFAFIPSSYAATCLYSATIYSNGTTPSFLNLPALSDGSCPPPPLFNTSPDGTNHSANYYVSSLAGVSLSTAEFQQISSYQTQLNSIQTQLNSMNTVYTELNSIVSQLSISQQSAAPLPALNQIDPVIGSALFTFACFLPIFFYLLSAPIGAILSLFRRHS